MSSKSKSIRDTTSGEDTKDDHHQRRKGHRHGHRRHSRSRSRYRSRSRSRSSSRSRSRSRSVSQSRLSSKQLPDHAPKSDSCTLIWEPVLIVALVLVVLLVAELSLLKSQNKELSNKVQSLEQAATKQFPQDIVKASRDHLNSLLPLIDRMRAAADRRPAVAATNPPVDSDDSVTVQVALEGIPNAEDIRELIESIDAHFAK